MFLYSPPSSVRRRWILQSNISSKWANKSWNFLAAPLLILVKNTRYISLSSQINRQKLLRRDCTLRITRFNSTNLLLWWVFTGTFLRLFVLSLHAFHTFRSLAVINLDRWFRTLCYEFASILIQMIKSLWRCKRLPSALLICPQTDEAIISIEVDTRSRSSISITGTFLTLFTSKTNSPLQVSGKFSMHLFDAKFCIISPSTFHTRQCSKRGFLHVAQHSREHSSLN